MLGKFKQLLEAQAITTVFQPVVDIRNNEILGYEALSRGPDNSEFASSDVLFQKATDYNLLSKLEILCRDKAIKRFAQLNLQGKLFLNVSPMVLLEKLHPQGETIKLVQNSGLICQQIVIEISEKYPLPCGVLLRSAIEKYRQFGFQVAIDDLGAGYSGLKQWSQLRPDIVKIDRYFVENCHIDSFKAKFLKAMFELGESANSLVIVEGVETQDEFECLANLGMQYVQGYYLARPTKQPAKTVAELNVSLQSIMKTVA